MENSMIISSLKKKKKKLSKVFCKNSLDYSKIIYILKQINVLALSFRPRQITSLK